MRDTYNAAKVGLLVVVTLASSIAIWRFVDESSAGDGGYSVYAIFDDVQGLVPKSRVLIAGIPVGTIESIGLEGARARVDLRINPDVTLYENARVSQRSASLLGEMLLVVTPGSPPNPELKGGDELKADLSAARTDDVLKTVGEIAESVKAVTVQLERSFGTDEAGERMSEALEDLGEALDAINRTIQANEQVVTRTLANVENITSDAAPKLERILNNVEVVTEDIRNVVRGNTDGLDKGLGRVDETIASINRSATQLESVLADVKQVSERTAKGEGTIGRLTKDEQLIDEVEGVVEGVGDIIGGVARLKTIMALRSEYNFLANTFKNYVGLQIQPREDRYYLFEMVADPRGRTSFIERQVRTSPPADGEREFYQETVTETRDSFRFSLMFAKRVYFATGRFGIIESTGGLGLDLHLWEDRLEVNTDVFAIGEKTFARLRSKLAYQVVKRMWILAGADDLLNEGSRDFFLGAMLKFDDEDLKSILPFAPAAAFGG